MAWTDRISDASLSMYYYIRVEGISTVLTSTSLPSGWFTGGLSQVVALDVSNGIKIPSAQLNRKTGLADYTQMSFRVGPDNLLGTLRTLFATRLSTGYQAILTETCGWTDGHVHVSTVAGAPATPFDLHVGRECMSCTAVNAGLLTLSVTRAQYQSVAWKFLVDNDYTQGTRLVSTFPRQWEGRVVRLYAGLSNAEGQPLDTALHGPDQHELWRGVIQDCSPEEPWGWWSIKARSIDSILDTEVGCYQSEGRLAWTNGCAAQSADWKTIQTSAYVLAGQETGLIYARDPATATWAAVTFTVATGPQSDMLTAIAKAARDALAAAYPAYDWTTAVVNSPGSEYQGGEVPAGVKTQSIILNVDDTAWEDGLYFRVLDGSVMRQAGFSVGDHGSAWQDALYPGTVSLEAFQDEFPPMVYLSRNATSILCREAPDQYGRGFPASGYAKINDGRGVEGATRFEVVHYSSITVVQAATPRTIRLDGVTRGQLQTETLEIWIPQTASEEDSSLAMFEDPAITVSSCIGFDSTSLFTLVLNLAVGTGGAVPRDATYDVAAIPELTAAGLDAGHFDLTHIADVATQIGWQLGNRRLIFSKQFNLREWLGRELCALGYCLLSRETASGYQITVDRIRQPLMVGRFNVTSADLVLDEWPTIRSNLQDVITAVEMRLAWDLGAEDWAPIKYLVTALDAQTDTGQRQTLKLDVSGLPWTGGTTAMQKIATSLATSILAHYGRKYEVVEFSMRKWGWQLRPGDQVNVTCPGVPRADGRSGWSLEPMIVLSAEPTYAGKGREAPVRVTCLHLADRKLGYYVPCGLITGVAGATITIAANTFTTASQYHPATGLPANDVSWFAAGQRIYLRRPGEEATYQATRIIDSIVGQDITLTVAPPVWVGGDPSDLICYCTYDSATTDQKKYVYIADNTRLLGAANDATFQYAP